MLQEVAGIEEARAVDRCPRRCAATANPGHTFGPFLRGADRAGAVLAVGESREEACTRADEAAALLRF